MSFVLPLAGLVGIQLATALCSLAVLHVARRAPRVRVAALLFLWVAYHVVVYVLYDEGLVKRLDFAFYLFQFPFVFRFLSSVYYYRRGDHVPTPGFHLALLLAGPRQHYGAGSWEDLKGERMSAGLLRRWLPHLGHNLAISAVGVGLTQAAMLPAIYGTRLGWTLYISGFGVLGLMVLSIYVDLYMLAWSVRGYFFSFFGRFPFFRSRHIGEFWRYWNVYAVWSFRELSALLKLGSRPFANTMIVFAASGLLHQIQVVYFTRAISFGTLAAFLFHGLAVWFFTWLYQRREKIPTIPRLLIFNPVTTLIVLVPISVPLILDFYGVMSVKL